MLSLSTIQSNIETAYQAGSASELLQLAVAAESLLSPDGLALANLAKGMSAVLTDDHTVALECLEASWSAFDGLGNRRCAVQALLSIGVVEERLAKYSESLVHYHRALSIAEEEHDVALKSACTTNIGILYARTGDLANGLIYLQRSLALDEERGDRAGAADVIGNIGIVYQQTGDYPSALEAYRKAVALHEEYGNRRAAAMTIGNIGIVYQSTGDYETALHYFSQALALHRELGNRASVARVTGNIGIVYENVGKYDLAIEHGRQSMALHLEIGNRDGHVKAAANVINAYVSSGRLQEARALLESVETVAVDNPQVQATMHSVKGYLLQQEGEYDEAHASMQTALRLASETGLRPIQADLHQALRDLAQKRNDFAGYIEHNNEYSRIAEEIKGKEATTKLAMQESQRKLEAQEREHAKHLAVLHSTLPKHVAERVARGEVVNDAFDDAAVLFLDVVGFTTHTSALDAGVVVKLLQSIFTTFDAICAEHNVMKIKTIGDSYMAVAFPSEHHIEDLAAVALAMQASTFTWPHTNEHVLFRIGLHCGPVVAGVLGTERMQYDVWGDTVNVASRMESAGEAGRIHISEAIAIELKRNTEYRIQNPIKESRNNKSHEVSHSVSHSVSHPVSHSVSHPVSHEVSSSLVTIERGSIDIKGKGPMRTYWLTSDQSIEQP